MGERLPNPQKYQLWSAIPNETSVVGDKLVRITCLVVDDNDTLYTLTIETQLGHDARRLGEYVEETYSLGEDAEPIFMVPGEIDIELVEQLLSQLQPEVLAKYLVLQEM